MSKKDSQFEKMTTEKIEKLLLALSVPAIMTMLVTTIYNIVDAAFVGLLGTSQSGATGIVNGFMSILQSVAFMCGQGAGSIASRKLGEKKNDEADKFASTAICSSFSLGLLISILSFIFMHQLLGLLGSTPTIYPYAKSYITYILIAAPFFTSSLTMNNLLRYEGKAKFGTAALMTGAILNIIGDAVFICGFHMGIAGAGLSTAISQSIGFCIAISMYLRHKTTIRVSVRFISKKLHDYFEIATTGCPSLMRQGLHATASMVLNANAAVYGDGAVAAMSIVSRLSFLPMAMAIGMGQGFQPISGFNYGAKRVDRVKEAFLKALTAAEIVLIAASVPMYIFAPKLVAILRNDPEVIEIGTRALRLMCIAQAVIPFSMMTEMGFQSTGQKAYALVSSSLRSGILFIPAIVIFSKLRGLAGIQEAQPVSIILAFFISVYLTKVYFDILKKHGEN